MGGRLDARLGVWIGAALSAALIGIGVVLIQQVGQVLFTNGDCLPPPGPPGAYRCYVDGHPHAGLGVALVIAGGLALLCLVALMVRRAGRRSDAEAHAAATLG